MNQNRGSSKRRGRRNDLGQALVEFSLVMSLLLVPIVLGMAGFAAYLSNFLALTDAVSMSAKQLAANRGANNLDPCGLVSTAITQAYKVAAMESATPTLTVTLTISNPAGTVTAGPTSATSCTTDAQYVVQGGNIKVSATHTVQSIFPSFGSFAISARSQEYVQ